MTVIIKRRCSTGTTKRDPLMTPAATRQVSVSVGHTATRQESVTVGHTAAQSSTIIFRHFDDKYQTTAEREAGSGAPKMKT